MTFIMKSAAAIVLIPLTFAFAAPAFAEENAESGEAQVDETQALMNAKISIADAIRAAETASKGKAVESGFNDENGAVSYQVEVLMPNGKRTDVYVTSALPGQPPQQVPLSSLAKVVEKPAPLSINHIGQFPAATISFNLAQGASLGDAVKAVEAIRLELGLPDSVQ